MATATPPRPAAETAPLDTRFFGHPRGLSTLFFTEMWERFSYYGMRALLILFMTTPAAAGGLGFNTAKAGPIYALYVSSVYLLSLPGGWMADRVLGLRRTVFVGGVIIMMRPHLPRDAVDHHVLSGPRADLGRHRAAQAQHERAGRHALRARRRATGRGVLDLLHGHQHRRVHRAADHAGGWRRARASAGSSSRPASGPTRPGTGASARRRWECCAA